jgi:hypothetical protein
MRDATPQETCATAVRSRSLSIRLKSRFTAGQEALGAFGLASIISGTPLIKKVLGHPGADILVAIFGFLSIACLVFVIRQSYARFASITAEYNIAKVIEIDSWHEAAEFLAEFDDEPIVEDEEELAAIRYRASILRGHPEWIMHRIWPFFIISALPFAILIFFTFGIEDELRLALKAGSTALLSLGIYVFVRLQSAEETCNDIFNAISEKHRSLSRPCFERCTAEIMRIKRFIAIFPQPRT